jgi:hypothetical protein
LAVDEIIVRFEGRSKEITTIPNKPIPTGYKVWGAAQRGFLLVWNWHIPGQKNGPLGIRIPRELSGTIKAGNGGNKTQAVVLHLIKRLPKLPKGLAITFTLIISLFLLALSNMLAPRELQLLGLAGQLVELLRSFLTFRNRTKRI